jgi:two-component system response regulator GlrR
MENDEPPAPPEEVDSADPDQPDRAGPTTSVPARRSLRSLFTTRNRALEREITALDRALELPSTILITGVSGTGKDYLARALHEASPRANRPFVRIDAANLSDDLFESELFGHERGAFTGAVTSNRGLLDAAEDGTAYLDEVS